MYATRSKYGNGVVIFTSGVYFNGPSQPKFASPKSNTPEESLPEMQYENLGNPNCVTNESDPRFIPINPVVFESSFVFVLNPESIHPNIVPGCANPPAKNVSMARLPSM